MQHPGVLPPRCAAAALAAVPSAAPWLLPGSTRSQTQHEPASPAASSSCCSLLPAPKGRQLCFFMGIPTPCPAAPPRPPPQPGAHLGLAQLQPGWSPDCFYPSPRAEALCFLPPRSYFLGYFLDTVPGSQLASPAGCCNSGAGVRQSQGDDAQSIPPPLSAGYFPPEPREASIPSA